MKKLILFCFTALTLAGCDGFCTMDFIVANQTQKNMVITMNEEQITIAPNGEQQIDHQGHVCGGTLEYEDDAQMINASMQIDGTSVPETIWKRKYWNVASKKSHSTYTLIVDDELLQSLETDNI